MSRFAAAGHRVFYVSQQFRQEGPPWSIAEKAPNIYEVTLRGVDLDIYRDSLSARARDLLFEALDALRRDVALSDAAIFVHLPFWWPLAEKVRQRFEWPVIYDCMDDHSGFSTARRKMTGAEEILLAEADLVVVSSGALEQGARKKTDRILVLRNGCDFEHFAAISLSGDERSHERPVIGYYGAIADWFDSRLVASLAKRRPEWNFILVGSTYDGDLFPLAGLPNISLPGEQAYETIPDWLARFDVAIIPFRRNPLTEATNPVKVYEMLAGGKPVVSVPIPEVAALAPMVRLASGVDEFEREIEAALAERGDPGAIAKRQEFARLNTWQKRYEELERATAATLE
jgi:glycosyltransferase involved in cell wall biosynthesis